MPGSPFFGNRRGQEEVALARQEVLSGDFLRGPGLGYCFFCALPNEYSMLLHRVLKQTM